MRARATVIRGRGHTYKAKAQRREESAFMTYAKEHQPARPLEGPLLLGVWCYMPVPSSNPKWWREAALRGDIRPTGKPDLSNVEKLVEDCLETLRFFVNDSQIVGHLPGAGKFYCTQPRYEIVLSPLEPPSSFRPVVRW